MNDPTSSDTPDRLRERAERCFRLAYGTTDEGVRDALVAYGRELVEKADALLKDDPESVGRSTYRPEGP